MLAATTLPTTDSSQSTILNHNAHNTYTSDHDLECLKRDYLRLLSLAQIIEICLAFETHVPIHIRNTIWPVDLHAAILALQKIPPPSESAARTDHPPENDSLTSIANADAPSQRVHPPGTPGLPPSEPSNPATIQPASVPETTTVAASTELAYPAPLSSSEPPFQKVLQEPTPSPIPVQSPPPPTSVSLVQPAFASVPPSHAGSPQPQPPSQPSTSQPPTQTATSQPADQPYPLVPQQPPYPYAPYGYPVQGHGQQPAYPHTPYYSSAPGYPAYPGYPPYPPPLGYPTPPPHASMYPSQPPPPHMHRAPPVTMPPPPAPAEDLPSYEDMIVEALLDISDPEGAAPKDLFTWMGARYPLQTNFRPSASQALQKAFRRGRLEKRPGGKYRLNPAWEGGATSKRTTRRPQTHAQNAYAMHHPSQPPSSPFTHTPLAQRQQTSESSPPPPTQPPPPGVQSYAGYSYGYPPAPGYPGYPSYPGYPAPPAPASTTQASPNTSDTSNENKTKGIENGKSTEESDLSGADGNDVWEAAQHILKAINFGSLQAQGSTSSNAAPTGTSSANDSGVTNGSAHPPPPVTAGVGLDLLAGLGLGGLSTDVATSSTDAAFASTSRGILTNEERASLQAQLALLAAQLTEIAELEEDEEEENPVTDEEVGQASELAYPPVTRTAEDAIAKKSVLIDVNQFPEEVHSTISATDDGSRSRSVTAAPVRAEGSEVNGMEEDDEDSDDDMEMVEVEVPTYRDALRT